MPTSDPLRIPTRCGLHPGTSPNKFIRIQDRYNHIDNNNNNIVDPHRGRGVSGDFDGDLLPRRIGTNNNSSSSDLDPFGVYRSGQPDIGGNLMGPDHPMFRPHHPNPMNHEEPPNNRFYDPAYLGVGGIRPRFDPYGPPPTRIDYDGTSSSSTTMMTGNPGLDLRMMNNNRRGIPPQTGFGPNPDHLRPTSSNRNGGEQHNNNMFL